MYPNNNNNNNNNNNKRKKRIKIQKWGTYGKDGERQRGRGERIFILFFLLFASFLYLHKSDRRFLLEQKAKLIHATKATRGHQNLGFSSNFKRYGIFLLVLFLT